MTSQPTPVAAPWLSDRVIAERRQHARDRAQAAYARQLAQHLRDSGFHGPIVDEFATLAAEVACAGLVLEADAHLFTDGAAKLVRYQQALLRARARVNQLENEIATMRLP